MDLTFDERCIVTAALTGVLANRQQCAAIPYSPVQIAEEARRAYEAGAAICHIHARDPETGGPTFELDVFRRIRDEVRARCPVLINFSTGGLGSIQDRCAQVRDLGIEIGALNMGSMNYAKYSPNRKAFVFEIVFENPFRDIIYLLEQLRVGGTRPEMEVFDAGHIGNTRPLIDMGLLAPPYQFNLVMGVLGGIPDTPETLLSQVRLLPAGAQWSVTSISRNQWRMLGAALAFGGNARVGLEDNFYLPDGRMAESNGDLVAQAVRMIESLGRRPATSDEARALLGLRADGASSSTAKQP